jgi:tetratricopeptide (TPR) repeat protein
MAEPGGAPPPVEEIIEEEGEGASGFVVILGWILFGLSFVGLCVMAYLFKVTYDRLASGELPPHAVREMRRLKLDLNQATNDVKRLDAEKGKADAERKAAVEEAEKLKADLAEEKEVKEKTLAAESRLEAEVKTMKKALGGGREELKELRARAETAGLDAARLGRRIASGAQAVRAAELLDRPALWGQALGFAEAATRMDDELASAHWVRGLLLARLRRPEDAIRAFDKVDELARAGGATGHARALVRAGDVCRKQLDDQRRAAEYYGRAAAAAPESPYGRAAAVRSAVIEGKVESASWKAKDAIKALKAGGADPTPVRLALAEILSRDARQRREAIAEATRAIAADPACVDALDLRGRLLLDEGRHHDAAADLTRAAELDPKGAERLILLGKAHLAVDRPEAAEPALRLAVKLLPRSAEAHAELGRALLFQGSFEEAVSELTGALAADDEHVEAYRLRGEARVALGRYRHGINDLEAALRIGRDDAGVRILLARTYATARDPKFRSPERAVQHARVAVELTDARNPAALAVRALAYASAGDYTRAAIDMQQALKLEPQNETYMRLLSIYNKRKGQ